MYMPMNTYYTKCVCTRKLDKSTYTCIPKKKSSSTKYIMKNKFKYFDERYEKNEYYLKKKRVSHDTAPPHNSETKQKICGNGQRAREQRMQKEGKETKKKHNSYKIISNWFGFIRHVCNALYKYMCSYDSVWLRKYTIATLNIFIYTCLNPKTEQKTLNE